MADGSGEQRLAPPRVGVDSNMNAHDSRNIIKVHKQIFTALTTVSKAMIVLSLHRSRSSHRLDKISLEQNKLLDSAGNKTRKLVNTACRVMSSIADLAFSAAPQYALVDHLARGFQPR